MVPATSRKRVLIIDDSVFARKIVSDMLSSSAALEVIGSATNGTEALSMIKSLNPDVVTLDVEMPGINGIETLRRIMAEHPTPVVMLSSLTVNGASESIQALSIGAVDVMAKPHGSHALGMTGGQREELVAKVLAAADVRLANLIPKPERTARQPVLRVAQSSINFPIVVIASSTGGPRALRTIVPDLPDTAGAAYVIVQHLPEGFSGPLAQDLDKVTHLNVRESSEGDLLNAGDAIFARAGYHTVFERGGRMRLTVDPPLWGVRPSADVTMASMVPMYGPRLIGVVLTGMGRDGANGVRLIKDAGGVTIAEHESSCVVYGMPKSAAETGAVDRVVPLPSVPDAVQDALLQVAKNLRRHRPAA